MEKEASQLLASFFKLLERIDRRLERLEELEKQKQEGSRPPKDRLIPLSKWKDHHSYPLVNTLRQLVFFADTNGASKFIR